MLPTAVMFRRGLRVPMIALMLALVWWPGARAADPASGTVSEATPAVQWTGPFVPPTATFECSGPSDPACDHFLLTITAPAAGFPTYPHFKVEITLQPTPGGDWDLHVFDPGGALVDSSGNPPGVGESVFLYDPAPGTYTVSASPFAPGPAFPSYEAQAALKPWEPPVPGTEPFSYDTYAAPAGMGRNAGEPSVGVNWNSNAAMYIAGLETIRLGFDDCSSPAEATWQDVSFLTTSIETLDPILFTDNVTGRTFASQLAGKTSLMAFSDDDGVNWMQSQGSGINSGVDHQTVGGGPFAAPLERDPGGPLYPHAVYYCSQDLADALCARSDDGGQTFGPAVPIYTLVDCGGLHGSVKVSPADGTVYVPNKGCGEQAVVVSENNGLTWEVRRVPTTSSAPFDPSVGIATDGTVYMGMSEGGHAFAAVSYDRGLTWENLQDVGAANGIENIAFPAVVAGDPDRAAFAFLGTTMGGLATASDSTWPGVWHLYVSHTYDGGETWTTLNVTPDDPVQRGMICSQGIDCTGARNLLDFNDADIDAFGRVVVAYADGCVGDCVDGPPNSGVDWAALARQSSGRRMFAAFDVLDVPDPVTGKAVIFDDDPATVHLSWAEPDDHGSPITAYNVYRRSGGGGFSLHASVDGDTRQLDDPIDPGVTYSYQITAVNASGESAPCGEIATRVQPNPCGFGGVASVTAPPEATCTLDLAWAAVPAGCPLENARYNVYRSTDPGFAPSLDSAVALGVSGLTYRDQDGLEGGVTYTYIVRAEDPEVAGSGPGGGAEDGNLVRRSGTPRGVLQPGPDFADDLEPAAQPGYATFSTRTAGGWEVTADPVTSHSGQNVWLCLDDQPGLPTLTQKDDTLTLPALNLTSASELRFWHNFDFAQFPLSGAATRYQSGGVLEISADGIDWFDVDLHIVQGGYNGVVDTDAQSPIKGRPAWVGSSDGDLGAGQRTDPMTEVVVDLGTAIQTIFGEPTLPGARVRFRLGGTFQILLGGIQGSGWGIDDLTVTGLLAPAACETIEQPGCSIDAVSPSSGAQGAEVDVTISGSGFQAGSSVVFSLDGDADDGVSEGAATVSADGSAISLSIRIDADAPQGPRDVTVIAPDGSPCVARAAFTVTGGGGATALACDDPSITRRGGWHQVADERSAFGQYCRNVGANKGNSGAFLEVFFDSEAGGTVSVIYARGPRGGNADAAAGSESRRIEFFRPAEGQRDASGRRELSFGFSETFTVPPGGGALRIDVQNDDPDPQRDMVYIEGFLFTESAAEGGQAAFQEPAAPQGGTVPAGGSVSLTHAPPAGSVLLTAVVDDLEGRGLTVALIDPLGGTVDTGAGSPATAQSLSILPGVYTLRIGNPGTIDAPFAAVLVPTVEVSPLP